MKRILYFILVIVACIAVTSKDGICADGSLPRVKDAGALKFGAETAMPWVQLNQSTGELMGLDGQFAVEIAKRLGVEAEMVETPWDGLIPALKQKKFDIILNGMYITEERKEIIDFAGPVYCYGETIVVRKDNNDIKKFDDLRGKKAGALKGSVFIQWLESLKEVEIVQYNQSNQVIIEVNNGRLDAGVLDAPMADWGIRKDPKLNTKLVEGYTPREMGRIGVGIRKEDKELKEAIDHAIKEMMADGTYERIVTSFGMPAIECK